MLARVKEIRTMKYLSLSEYLLSPCRASSIPYWKAKITHIPDNIQIVHDKNYEESKFADYVDEPYFRLYHSLQYIERQHCDGISIVTASNDNIAEFARIINASYDDLSVTEKQLLSYRKTPVFKYDLWILLKDTYNAVYVGCGIADFDCETQELILEWIQVLPQYRRRGLGGLIVNELLYRMQHIANFATVSGKLNNDTHPEKLYRKCGFTGNDIWHVLYKKQ